MYAIVNISGQQFKVERGNRIYVNRLSAAEGADLEFGEVLLTDDGTQQKVGAPHVDGFKVAATVVEHLRADKILVFKKKRRKSYQKLNGHRQDLTQIIIQGILGKGESVTEKLEVKKHDRGPRKMSFANNVGEEAEVAGEETGAEA